MTYYKIEPEYYQNANIFKQKTVKKNIENLLKIEQYTKKQIDSILYKNFENKILRKLNK